MAESVVNVANTRITFTALSGGTVTIEVVENNNGQVLGIGNDVGYDTAPTVLSDAISSLNRQIKSSQSRITRNTSQIDELNIKLSQPDILPVVQKSIKDQITKLQQSKKESELIVAGSTAALSYLQANGSAMLASVVDKAKAASAATATAKPTTVAPVTPAPAANITTKNPVTGAANDDSGTIQTTNTNGVPKSPSAAAGASGSTPDTTATNKTTANGPPVSSTSNQGASQGDSPNASVTNQKWQYSTISNQTVNTTSSPGKRLKNPLGEFSSYTYQLTLYMITPDAYDAFVASGRTKINIVNNVDGLTKNGINPQKNGYSGAFIVAQSGGVNNKTDVAAPGFVYDLGIDDLTINSLITGKATGSPTQVQELSFNIREPYGFRFLTQLRKAGDALFGTEVPITSTTSLRQTFILGIKFYGYDASGRVMNPNMKMAADGVNNGQANYVAIDPGSTDGSLFEHYLDIMITELRFKIDGKMVTYNIKAINKPGQDAFKISKGTNKEVTTITGVTVGDAIDQLMVKLNAVQQNYAKGNPPSILIPTTYKVVWGPNTEDIWSASLASPTDTNKIKSSFPATNSADATVSKEVNTQSVNTTVVTINEVNDKPIIQIITDIVKQSTFTESQLKVLYTDSQQADPKTKSLDKQANSIPTNSPMWINISPQISDIKYDTKARDFAYTITYFITKYSIPILDTPVVAGPKIYPGPHKRYDYWYTGKNTEVISYEQTLDNTFIQVVQGVGDTVDASNIGSSGTGTQTSVNPSSSVAPLTVGMNQSQPRTGAIGPLRFDTQNSFLTALYDASSYVNAKLTIMGDPDYLPVDAVYNEQILYDQYYHSGTNQYSINASGGQVFVEINFEEAVDYSTDGLLSINEQIAFVKYPPSLADKIKGVSYFVIAVNHSFSNGVFKQTLELQQNFFGTQAEQEAAQKAVQEQQTRNQQSVNQVLANGPQPSNSNATGTQTGTPSDPPTSTNPSGPAAQKVPPVTASPQGTTKNGGGDDKTGN